MVRVSSALFGLLLFHASVAFADDDQSASSKSKCSSFTLSGVDDATVTKKTYYPKGTRVNLSTSMSSLDTDDLQSFCRIELTITTNATASSSAHTEVWLPNAWNNRFLTFGNGGFSGGGELNSPSRGRCQTDPLCSQRRRAGVACRQPELYVVSAPFPRPPG